MARINSNRLAGSGKAVYPEEDQAFGSGAVEWSRIERATKGRSTYFVVPVICGGCHSRIVTSAISVVQRIREDKFTSLCRSCRPSARAATLLAGYRSRPDESQEPGSVVLWASTKAKPDGRFVVQIRCRCETVRWVQVGQVRHSSGLCRRCATSVRATGPLNGRWVGGRSKANDYWMIRIPPNDPMIEMAEISNREGWGKVLEHRYVAANAVGRPLECWEHVHHRNGNKEDNQPENLEVLSPDKHQTVTAMQREIYRLRRENQRLRKECGLPEPKCRRSTSPMEGPLLFM